MMTRIAPVVPSTLLLDKNATVPTTKSNKATYSTIRHVGADPRYILLPLTIRLQLPAAMANRTTGRNQMPWTLVINVATRKVALAANATLLNNSPSLFARARFSAVIGRLPRL